MQYLIDTGRFCRNADVSSVYRRNPDYFHKMMDYVKGLGKGTFLVEAASPQDAIMKIYGPELIMLNPVTSHDYKHMIMKEAFRQSRKAACESLTCLDASGSRKKALEPVKRLLLNKLYTDNLTDAAINDGALDDTMAWCIDELEKTDCITAAYSDKQSYYRFCANAKLPSWYQWGVVELIDRNSESCVRTLKRDLLPNSKILKNKMAEYMTGQPENVVECETQRERKNRLRAHLDAHYAARRRTMKRTKDQKPPGTRRKKLSEDYLELEKLFTGKPVQLEMGLLFP